MMGGACIQQQKQQKKKRSTSTSTRMTGTCCRVASASVLLLLLLHDVNGFAYAPNFITKIIQDQTKITPVGLLEINQSNNNEEDDNNSSTETSTSTSPSTQLKRPVTTRFPPEPNGYLHLGHAKAVCFNFAVARMFGGKCHMRMDDTNPSKEDEEYVQSILQDVKWIQSGLYDAAVPWDGDVKKTSDYFDIIHEAAVALIKQGDAYVDSLSADEMRDYRGTLTEPGKDSPYRTRSIEENLELFEGMRNGKFQEGQHVLRAKIDMSSPNINLRDPALYRIKHESHQETGDKWCIYPMYDFSHPIADALEGITHSLCTLEFEDHRPFYDWTIEKLLPTGLLSSMTTTTDDDEAQPPPPQQIEFSRLNVKNTVLSKRKLIQLVEQKYVTGWDDPRMPTMSGLRRRGIPPSALRLFCERVGISKADSNIDAVVLEDCVREVMDETCLRAFCVLKPLQVTITNWKDDGDGDALEDFEVPRHPKRAEMGTRTIPFGKSLYIERDDFFDVDGPEGDANNQRPPKGFKRLLPDDKVRLRYAYVIQCNEVVRDPNTREPVELKCEYFPDTRAGVTPGGMARVNGIIHWVEASRGQKCAVNQYDRLFLAEEPGRESGDFSRDVNPNSLEVLSDAVVEPSVVEDALSAIQEMKDKSKFSSLLAYQFERNGYFALDESSTGADNLVFNRVVTLRDTWGAQKKQGSNHQQEGGTSSGQRNRGRGQQQKQTEQTGAAVEDIRRVAFRAATILSAEPHPEADNLLVCQVDCGDTTEDGKCEPPRTVVAGLAGKIPLDELVGRKVVAVTNLKPAKMRGIESNAMLLAASNNEGEKVELLTVPESVPNGELLSFEGKETSEPDSMLKSKGAQKVWEKVKSSLRASDSGEALYLQDGSAHRMVTSEGAVKTTTLTDVPIQ